MPSVPALQRDRQGRCRVLRQERRFRSDHPDAVRLPAPHPELSLHGKPDNVRLWQQLRSLFCGDQPARGTPETEQRVNHRMSGSVLPSHPPAGLIRDECRLPATAAPGAQRSATAAEHAAGQRNQARRSVPPGLPAERQTHGGTRQTVIHKRLYPQPVISSSRSSSGAHSGD